MSAEINNRGLVANSCWHCPSNLIAKIAVSCGDWGKESKCQKQFICPKMAKFGVDSSANVIAIYFKLVGNTTPDGYH